MLPALGYVNRPRFAGGVNRMGLDGIPGTARAAGGATNVGTAAPTKPMIGFRGKGALTSGVSSVGAPPESVITKKEQASKLSPRPSTERLDALETWQKEITSKSEMLLDQRKHHDELQLEMTKAMCKIETLQTETNSLRQTLNATTQADRSNAAASLSVVPVLQKKMQSLQEAIESLSKRLQPLEETVKKSLLASQEAFAQSLQLIAQTTQALQVQDTEGRVWSIEAHQPLLLRPPSTVVNGTLYMQTILPCIIEENLEHLLCTVPIHENGTAMVTFQPAISNASKTNASKTLDPCFDAHMDAPTSSTQKRQKTYG